MSENVKDTAKTVFDYLQLVLRYLASGFVCITVLASVDQVLWNSLKCYLSDLPWFLVFIAGVAGLIIYTLHQALLDGFYYFLSVSILYKWIPTKIKEAAKCKKNWRVIFDVHKIMVYMIDQTLLRRSEPDKKVSLYQRELDIKIALLNFIYCTAFTFVVVVGLYPIICNYCNIYTVTNHNVLSVYKKAGIVLYIIGFLFDLKLTKKEISLIERYPIDGAVILNEKLS